MEVSEDDEQGTRGKIEAARACAESEDFKRAMDLVSEVLDENFNDPLALFLAGYCFLRTERFGLAYNVFLRVAQMSPRSEAWNNAGMCHQETWNLDDAEKCFRKALQIEPDNVAAAQNMALIYVNRCEPEKALRWVSMVERAGEPSWECIDNKALALLMLRQWREGWAAYDQTAGRHKQRQLRTYRSPEEPRWRGERGTVVVYGVQGLGDEVSFASCIPDACEKADVIIDCDHRLEGLFKRSFPKAKVYGTRFIGRQWTEEPDYSIPIDCLPHLFRNEDKDFPGTAYLIADPERSLQWKSLFQSFGKPVIGIAWTGGIPSTGQKKRSLTLNDIKPILESVDAVWVSLEYKNRKQEIDKFAQETGIRIQDYPRATRTQDYDDAAGMVAALDSIVTVTTAVVHLSGALGKDCFCLAPNKPRWFYGLEGDLPWYKSVRMFRQSRGGEWPIEDVVRALRLRYSR